MNKILKYYYKKLVLVVIAALFIGFFSMLPMVFFQKTIDASIQNYAIKYVIINGLLYIFIYLIAYLFKLKVLNYAYKLDNHLKRRIRDCIYEDISGVKLSTLESIGKNNAFNLIIDNLKELDTEIIVSIVQFTFILSSFVTGLVIMASYSFKLLIMIIPLSILSTLIIHISSKQSSVLAKSASELRDKVWFIFLENIRGHREITLYNQQEAFNTNYFQKSKVWERTDNKRVEIENRSSIIASISFSFFIGLVIIIGSQAVSKGYLSIGALVAILMYNHMITDPVFNLIHNQKAIFNLYTAMKNIDLFKAKLYSDEVFNLDVKITEDIECLSLKAISINYGSRCILDTFNLDILKSDKILIVGPSGVGKSTLIKLLTGAYEPDKGSIFVNGRSKMLNERFKVGYVFQDDFLFQGSIMDNIIFTNPQNEENILDKIIEITRLEELIEIYGEENIGDEGIRLSGGEKKRVLIARALYSDASLLLFDEISAGLNHDLFVAIFKDLLKIFSEKTFVFIEHKKLDNFIFDKVIELEMTV